MEKFSSVRPFYVSLCLVVAVVFISGASISRNSDQSRASIRQTGLSETITQQKEHSEQGDQSGASTAQADQLDIVSARPDQSEQLNAGRKGTALSEEKSTKINGMVPAADELNIMIRCVNIRTLVSRVKRTTDFGLEPLCDVFISSGQAVVEENAFKQTKSTEKDEDSDEESEISPYDDLDIPAKRQQTIPAPDGRKRIKPLEHFVRKHFLIRDKLTTSAKSYTSTTPSSPPRILEKDLRSLMPSATSNSVNSAFSSETTQANSVIQGKQTPASFASEKTDAAHSSQTHSGFQNIYVLKKHVRKTHPVF